MLWNHSFPPQSLLPPEFEKFLSTPEADKAKLSAYKELYQKALDCLNKRQPAEAWQILFQLSEFEWDAGLSKQIANRVRAVWDTNGTAKGLLGENDKLQERIRTANWNADMAASRMTDAQDERAMKLKDSKGGGQAVSQAASDSTKNAAGTLRMTEEYFKSLDSKARIKLNEVKVDNIQSKAKADLVDYITTLYKSRRYSHALLASEFYQALFLDGELPPEVANQATASLEMTRDIAKAVDAFEFKASAHQMSSASVILQDAWEKGDTTLEMLGIERAQKLRVIEHANRVRRMKNLIEARNFGALEAVLDEMDKEAVDFDTTKPRALIQAIKLDSRMRLGKARLAAQQGDPAKAMEEFKAAAQAWPGNPDLEKASSEYFAVEDKLAKGTRDFDEDFARQDYRAIFKKQVEYLALVQRDDKRQAQFRQALERVKDAETALEKARMLDGNGDAAGAWETVEIAAQAWPQDPQLNQARGDYASKSPEFVGTLRKAQQAEKEGARGAGLSYYALARKYYPVSLLAREGLKRVSADMLAPDQAKEKQKQEEKPAAAEKQG